MAGLIERIKLYRQLKVKKLDSDKIYQGLMEEYKKILAPLRCRPISLLEIGVDKGGSLLYWDDYLEHPDARIVGIDIKLPDIKASKRVTTRICNQNDTEALEALSQEFGPWDVIIDDGSHYKKETENSFNALYPHVAAGGYYVIEDWAVGYFGEQAPEFAGMVDVITDIMHRMPELNICTYNVILEVAKTMAFFQKGAPRDS